MRVIPVAIVAKARLVISVFRAESERTAQAREGVIEIAHDFIAERIVVVLFFQDAPANIEIGTYVAIPVEAREPDCTGAARTTDVFNGEEAADAAGALFGVAEVEAPGVGSDETRRGERGR